MTGCYSQGLHNFDRGILLMKIKDFLLLLPVLLSRNQGQKRKEELYRACATLGVDEGNITVLRLSLIHI